MLKKTPFESCIFCTWGKFGFSSSMIHTVSSREMLMKKTSTFDSSTGLGLELTSKTSGGKMMEDQF